jgi:hypothetical protein
MPKVKTIKMDKVLIYAWKRKYSKNGDQRIRDLMLKDLKE